MTDIKDGDTVRIHYTGTLTDGSVFDSSEGRDPLEFVVGSGHIIKGLDVALPGMHAGDKKTVNIDCVDAYGPINPAMHQAVPRDAIPDDIPLEVGMQLQMQTPQGQPMPVTVTEIKDDEIMLDANHPLAGRDLVFEIQVVSFDAG
ncbi:MAG: peptidylprolyl isomerase [Tateyamaria sp.]|uniref:FKBP-type peptidyl-prolyl cis-trans isomerase n=1 Tax=Tateyamaria sp. TaxID=1929288 RepID=UPI0032858367